MIFILFSCLISSLLLKDGWTALMWASRNGHHEAVRTLVVGGADVNTKNKVRNQLMMMMLMMTMLVMFFINDEDRDYC